MAERDLEVDVYDFLERIQLEQFFEKIDKVLHLTRLAHFDHVAESDLSDINMSKPEQRRLFDAIKKHKKERKKASKTRFSLRKKKKDSSCVVPSNGDAPKHSQGKSCLINESSVKLLGELGDGAFGVVHKGEWTPSKGSKITVAVKGLKFSDKDAFIKEQDNFMHEASAMSDLDHTNVIRLFGIVLATPIKLVMELAPLGSLHDRLKTEPQKFLISTLYDFVLQVASGMSYLESKRYVHRDLAARNILLASYDKVKIGDFGLMRLLPTEDGIYIMNPTGKVAVAWCAPECLKNREFSHASDVWAFGITVIEIFSYGKQPWDGLSGVQILDIIDEPANGRPGKPDHCPEKLYSLLIEHCWDPKPKDRSKFSSIKDKLQEAIPEEVTMFSDLKKGENPDNLVAKSGDLVTVITWKSRLGTEFAKGQNKRTAEVGYFPTSRVTRNILKNKSSGARLRIPKVKDISPPLDNSFSHCAHRGHGDTPNWGTITSVERQVLGKHHPLNLPTKLISLNNSDGENQIVSEASWDTGEIDTCSLMSRDSVNYSSSLSLGQRSWADSGYYSNRDTFISQDYEPMAGSNPIAIPGISPPGRQIVPPGVNHPGTYNPTHYSRRPSGASLQIDPYHVQRCVEDSFWPDGATIVPSASGLRPALPIKQGLIGNHGNMRPVSSGGFHTNGGIWKPGNENPYENFSGGTGTKYEDMTRLSPLTPQVSEGPQISSSSESVSKNQRDIKSEKSFNFLNINYPTIYDRPAIDNLFDCQRTGRCYSFPEVDMKTKLVNRELKRNSFSSCDQKILLNSLNESKSAPILDRDVAVAPNVKNWEIRTPDEALNEDIYENIEIYNVPQAIMSEIPPPLPVKRRSSERRVSVQRNSGSHDLDISKKLVSTEEVFEEHYSSPVSTDAPSKFDAHLYAEISDKLIEELNVKDQNGMHIEEKSSENIREQCKGSFTEISKDYADLDAICAKLREKKSEGVESAENDEAQDELGPCVFEFKNETSNKHDVLWRRLSTDPQRIEQYTRRSLRKRRSVGSDDDRVPSNVSDTRQSSSASNQSVSNNSLKHACSELEIVQSLHTCTSLVTTV